MNKFNKCLIIAQSRLAALELSSAGKEFAQELSLVCLGAPVSAEGVDKVYALADREQSVTAYSTAIAALIKEQGYQLVLAEQCRNGRLMAGIAAAVLGVGVQTDAFQISAGEKGIVTKKLSYGGFAALTEESGSCGVICVGAGMFPAAEEKEASEPELLSPLSSGIGTLERKEKLVQRTNLAAARRVVGVGRGVKDAESLALAEKFASAMEAELGCTRPVAEEDHLLPTSRYIGVSGVTVRPEVYFALGISGQIQHTAGCDQAGLIFAVNKDEHAPIFKGCDFGIVGDLNKLLPKLMEALANK